MAWIVESDGVDDSLTSATIGNVVASKLRVVSTNVTWQTTGYLWSQAGATVSTREFGLWLLSGTYRVYAGGSSTVVATEASFPISNVTVDLTVDYNANTAILIIDGVTAFNGAITAGTGRVNNEAFRAFARGGGFFAQSGTRVGNTEIYIDDVLVRNYDFDNSSHGSGTVTVDDITASNDWTGVNMATDGSPWVDLGGGVTVTAATANYNYSEIAGVIDLTGEVMVTGQTANYDYAAITATIELGTEIIVTGQTANYNYTGIDGSIELTGLITVIGQTANYDYDGIAADITLQGSIVVTGSTANYDYNALNATIILQGPITINPKNIIRVKRKSNTIRVKRKSNTIIVR